MKKHHVRSTVALALPLIVTVFLSACSMTDNVRTPSSGLYAAVSVAQAQQDASLPVLDTALISDHADDDVEQEVSSNGAVAGAQPVLWGGTISRVENLADQRTLLEIVSRPLRSNGRPVHNDHSFGRFVAVVDEFLDPQIITINRDITVVAFLSGRFSGKVGQSDYLFPLVDVESYTYWKKVQKRPVTHFPHWHTHPHWFADPYWRAWYRRQLKNRRH